MADNSSSSPMLSNHLSRERNSDLLDFMRPSLMLCLDPYDARDDSSRCGNPCSLDEEQTLFNLDEPYDRCSSRGIEIFLDDEDLLWTPDEDALILTKYKSNKWRDIAIILKDKGYPQRSPDSIKSRFTMLRKKLKSPRSIIRKKCLSPITFAESPCSSLNDSNLSCLTSDSLCNFTDYSSSPDSFSHNIFFSKVRGVKLLSPLPRRASTDSNDIDGLDMTVHNITLSNSS